MLYVLVRRETGRRRRGPAFAVGPQPAARRLRAGHGVCRVGPARLRHRLLPGPAPGRRPTEATATAAPPPPAPPLRRRRPAGLRRRADPAHRGAAGPGRRGRAGALVAPPRARRTASPASVRTAAPFVGVCRLLGLVQARRWATGGPRCGSSSRTRTTAGCPIPSSPLFHDAKGVLHHHVGTALHVPWVLLAAGPARRLLAPAARPLHALRRRGPRRRGGRAPTSIRSSATPSAPSRSSIAAALLLRQSADRAGGADPALGRAGRLRPAGLPQHLGAVSAVGARRRARQPGPALPAGSGGPLTCPFDGQREDAPVVIAAPGPAASPRPTSWSKRGEHPVVLEADDVVGGISRTVERDGWRFDIGGHRFFTKVPEVEALWHEILPDEDFLLRPRMSRIYYEGKFYDYPLQGHRTRCATSALVEAVRCVLLLRLGPHPPAEGPDQLRGLGRRPLRLAPLPHVLQDLHREGLGRAGRRACRPTGPPSGSRTSSLRKADRQRPPAQAQPDGDHLADRGVPVPEVRPRDDVGALPRQGRGRRARRC